MIVTIDTFMGLAPRLGDNLPMGMATIAENVDLSSGKIRPLGEHRKVSAEGGGSNQIYFWNGQWHSGNDRWFVEWNYETLQILYYLDGKQPKRQIGSATDTLGQPLPAEAPTVALNGSGVLNGQYQYFYCTKRTVNGYTDLSGPSPVSEEIAASDEQIRITRRPISDPDVTHWWLYRTSSNTGAWNFVAEIPASQDSYDDNLSDAQVSLNEGPITWYDSDQGNSILLQGPPQLEGLAQELHAGMLVGWNGPDIYWSEPLMPDSWDPDTYRVRSPYDVIGIYSISGMLAVLTRHGPYRIDGQHPELLAFRKALSCEPSVQAKAVVPTQRGLFYLSDSGIALFDTIGTQILSDSEFDEDWFTQNVNPSTARLAYNDDQLLLTHSEGILVCDMRAGRRNWYTLTAIATALYRKPDDGRLYLALSDGIYELHGRQDSLLTWTWRSGDITFNTLRDKYFERVQIQGSGVVNLRVYVDGMHTGTTKSLIFGAHERDRSLQLPRIKGRAIQIELSGTGEVQELSVEASL